MTDVFNPTSEADSGFRLVGQQPSLDLMEEIGLAVEGDHTEVNCVTIGIPGKEDRVVYVSPLGVNNRTPSGKLVSTTYFNPTKAEIARMRAELLKI